MIGRVVCIAFFCAVASGCPSSETREDRAVLAALDTLRDSAALDLPERRARIEKLEKLPASTPYARSARDDCVKAYRALVDSKEALANLTHAIDDPEGSAKEALAGWADTEDLIKRSEQTMVACEKAAAELNLKLR